MATARVIAWTLAMSLALGCGDAGPPTGSSPAPSPAAPSPGGSAAPATPPPPTAAFDAAAPPAPQTPVDRLLAWLDPDAIGATLVRADLSLDAESLTTIFAVPTMAGRMLRELEMADEGLAILLGEQVKAWLAPDALAMLPPIGRGSTIVRLLKAPRAEVEAALAGGEMEPGESEGYAVWSPRGAFPWRLIFLDDATIALVPVAEIGGGLGPLTAARDLPASALEKEMSKALAGDPDLALELVAQGPFVHLDLAEDVGVVRLSLRRWQGAGLDGTILLQPLGDPLTEAAALEGRRLDLETDRIRELADRVAFTAEPPMILGRAQLPAEDVVALRRRAP